MDLLTQHASDPRDAGTKLPRSSRGLFLTIAQFVQFFVVERSRHISSLSSKRRSTLQRESRSYLFTPVVGVSAGFCVAPDFGMTVSFMVVAGIFGW
jgi:hypothetical protein